MAELNGGQLTARQLKLAGVDTISVFQLEKTAERSYRFVTDDASQIAYLLDVIEGIVLHAFEGRSPFSAASIERIEALKSVYGLDLTAEASHRLREKL